MAFHFSKTELLKYLISLLVFSFILSLVCQTAGAIDRKAEKLPFEIPKDILKLPPTALIETTKGPIEIRLFREIAPTTVRNFEFLAERGTYNNTYFYRFDPGYLIQGGAKNPDGKEAMEYSLPPENSDIKHQRGTIGMARFPGVINPRRRSHANQFYITLDRAQHLDGLYTVFAEVINGFDVLEQIRKNDQILRVRLPKKYD